ncbi:ANR family transcriptional regulator [Salmonella enterica subsp. enterica serovar Saintpaul]|nr:ANR family transcriptional regulator [Salmonella enterica]EBS5929815.1 ANR family transcriptional regulator [Salmonella enterica subsp. enterica serovar Saintpaul]EBU1126802.1 ANR family transcriptional regulator [Salmonella enterica]EBU1139978.1 ANR family transcriptional regulator [Salmonella enterica]EEA1388282.1 ANR family transcriptional regulator [Salmonella enterica]
MTQIIRYNRRYSYMKIKFMDTARQAADMERMKDFRQAGQLWSQALFVARNDVNAEYCRLRADFCLSSMFTRNAQQ